MTIPRPLPPGSTLGIIGGGQLGRMTALAAADLGYRCHIFTPERDSPAAQVSHAATVAAYDDEAALAAFAAAVDVVTFEFENIPAASVRLLEERVTVRPAWTVLRTTQDRLLEKDFVNATGVATAPYAPVADLADLEKALGRLGRPAVLKTRRLGYDGKGQATIGPDSPAAEAWARIGAPKGVDEAILEGFVDFACEVSVVVARGADGACAAFDTVENRHENHILKTTLAPARIPSGLAAEAGAIARRLAEALDLIGLLAVEMFVTRDGRLLVNELAPRPHNSGHWTIDACGTSQFEQFVRAVCGLPLGAPERHGDAVMTNLIGDDVDQWLAILGERTARLHLYGKAESRPGRKMGHVTQLYPRGGIPHL